MRVFNADKNQELTEYDIAKGYLQEDKLFVAHHEAIAHKEEIGHYETVKEYPNGGKDVEWIVDKHAVEGKDAYDEYEDIQVYVEYTEAELAAFKISELKNRLSKTDYQAIKYAEGEISAEDYEPIKIQRREWRTRINELENAKIT